MIHIIKLNKNLIVEEKDIDNTLEALQAEVEGLITTAPIYDELHNLGIDIFADDEGLLKADPIKTLVKIEGNKINYCLVGNLVLVGYTPDGDTVSLTQEQLDFIKQHLHIVKVSSTAETFEAFTFIFNNQINKEEKI